MSHLIDNAYPDIFVCELTKIEKLGNNRRLIFTVPYVDASPDAVNEKTVAAKLIVPAEIMADLALMIGADAVAISDDRRLTALQTRVAN